MHGHPATRPPTIPRGGPPVVFVPCFPPHPSVVHLKSDLRKWGYMGWRYETSCTSKTYSSTYNCFYGAWLPAAGAWPFFCFLVPLLFS